MIGKSKKKIVGPDFNFYYLIMNNLFGPNFFIPILKAIYYLNLIFSLDSSLTTVR